MKRRTHAAYLSLSHPTITVNTDPIRPGKRLKMRQARRQAKLKGRGRELLLRDPTRTLALRTAFIKELTKRFKRLRAAIVDLIVRQDALGLKDRQLAFTGNAFCPTGPGGGIDPTCSPIDGDNDYVDLLGTIVKDDGTPASVGIANLVEAAVGILSASQQAKLIDHATSTRDKVKALASADTRHLDDIYSQIGVHHNEWLRAVEQQYLLRESSSDAGERAKRDAGIEEWANRIRNDLVPKLREHGHEKLADFYAQGAKFADGLTTNAGLPKAEFVENSNDFFARCERDEGGRCVAGDGTVDDPSAAFRNGFDKVFGVDPWVKQEQNRRVAAANDLHEGRGRPPLTKEQEDLVRQQVTGLGDERRAELSGGRFIKASVQTRFTKGRPVSEVRIDFGVKSREDTSVAARMEPESLAMLRKVRETVKVFHEAGFRIVAKWADERRQDVYHKWLTRMGLRQVKGKEDEGVWNVYVEPVANAGPWAFQSDPHKVQLFLQWLKRQLRQQILDERPNAPDDAEQRDDAYWREFIQQGFEKGAGRAYDDYVKNHPELKLESLDFYRGTKAQFLKSSFAQPESIDKVKLLAGRTYTELKGVTEDMSQRMSRVLVQGLVEGLHPNEIAKRLNEVTELGLARCKTIARFELASVHSEGQLIAFKALGVEELGVAVEWTTSGRTKCSTLGKGDSKKGCVCPICEALEGIVVKTSEASGMLPQHVGCFCSWVPANVGEDRSKQKRTYKQVKAATDKAEKEGGKEWDIDKDRTEAREPSAGEQKFYSGGFKVVEARVRSANPTTNFDPDQARDEHGRFGPADAEFAALLANARSSAMEREYAQLLANAKAEGVNCGTGAGGFQPGNTCARGGEGGIQTRTGVKDAKQWVSDRILTRKGDKVLNDILPDKVKQLLADSKTIYTDDAYDGAAAGVTRRWDEGASIKWDEGDVNIALHEMGHAVLYQGRSGEQFLSSSLSDHWIPAADKAIEEYTKLKGENDVPPLFLDRSRFPSLRQSTHAPTAQVRDAGNPSDDEGAPG